MEKQAFEITIEVLTKEISRLRTDLYLEECRRELSEAQVAKLQAENKHLNELLTPTKKGADNE